MKLHRSVLLGAGLILALGACGSDAKSPDTTPTAPITVATTVAAGPTSMPPGDSMAPGGSMAPATTGADAPSSGPATANPGSMAGDEKPVASTSVAIGDFKYAPAMVKVSVGGTVTFTNNDDTQHTATLTGVFDTGPLAKGESKAITFDKPGTYKYSCSFHPFMSGTIVVV